MLIYLVLFGFNIITIPFFYKSRQLYLYINSIAIWLIMANRGITVGSDTRAYFNIFANTPNTYIPMNFINWLIPFRNARFENGFLILNKIIYSFSSNFHIMLIISSAIMIICFLFFLIKLDINYILGVIIFESTFMSFSMNVMRQALALSFCLVAFVFAVQGKLGKFLIFNYLAILMHVTAWLFVIVYILRYIKINFKNILIVSAVGMLLVTSFQTIYGHISSISVEAASFSNSIANNHLNGSFNIIYNIVFIIIILFVFKKSHISENNILVNMSQLMLLLFIVFNLVAFHFSQIVRISMYFEIGLYPILSNIVGGAKINSKKIIPFVIIVTYLILHFIVIQTLRPEWANIVPYQIWINMY